MADETEQIIDEILVMDAQAGRVEALEALVSRWQKRLWRYACDLTGRTDAAWDVTQETWLGIVRGIHRLHDPAHFRAWAYRIVTNKANDWIGRERRRAHVQSQVPDPPATGGATSHTDVANDLRVLLHRLSDNSRTVLTLHYVEGFALAEVADILRIAPGTVKSRLHTARNELRRLWQEHGQE
jgi:RNA polymerase sigma-70 factor (ECF subfamily)